MILDAYYRENHYNPLYQLRSSISILLQIPFFLAAYNFLGVRATTRFMGTDFWCFKDLSEPDGLISIGGAAINVMPVLMTIINLIATVIYTKGMSVKTILRSLILPVLFLIILYNSPSALLIYWTMNNLYSLVKTIIIKSASSHKKKEADHKTGIKDNTACSGQKAKYLLFILPMVFMSVLTGLLIPLAYLSASPEEFVDIITLVNPLSYLTTSFLNALGFFVLWPSVFYYLAGTKTKHVLSVSVIGIAVFSVVNYLFFGSDTGTINTTLVFDHAPSSSLAQKMVNLAVLLLIMAACIFLYRFKNALICVFCGAILTSLTLSYIDAKKVRDAYKSVVDNIEVYREEEAPRIMLSSEGKNVMVIMLDKAVSGYIPYIFNEEPELAEKFDGFVFYPNSLCFAQNTLLTSSALFGGYEYTAERQDLRVDETLASKHDEALKILPELFSENGYYISLIDLPFPGWNSNGDYSSFEDIENCYTYHAKDYYSSGTEAHGNTEQRRNRNLFMYGIFKCSTLFVQEMIYDNGNYLSAVEDAHDIYDFTENYKVLENLTEMTRTGDDLSGGLLLMNNEATHDLSNFMDSDPNTPYAFEEGYSVSDGESELFLYGSYQAAAYECLTASLNELGVYFDYLRETGVYDNTRIILVGDHGTNLYLFDELYSEDLDAEFFNCLLMVKDFDAEGFALDYTFMTNADVPSLALKDIVDDPVNPYTGNPINTDPKHDDLFICFSPSPDERLWNPSTNPGNTFYYDDNCVWYKLINEDIFDHDNWVRTEKPE